MCAQWRLAQEGQFSSSMHVDTWLTSHENPTDRVDRCFDAQVPASGEWTANLRSGRRSSRVALLDRLQGEQSRDVGRSVLAHRSRRPNANPRGHGALGPEMNVRSVAASYLGRQTSWLSRVYSHAECGGEALWERQTENGFPLRGQALLVPILSPRLTNISKQLQIAIRRNRGAPE